MRNGQSWFDPARVKVRTYPVVIADGETLAARPWVSSAPSAVGVCSCCWQRSIIDAEASSWLPQTLPLS